MSERWADCHHDRRYHAKGLCRECYLREWKRASPRHPRKYVESDEANEKRKARKRNRYYLLAYGITEAERNVMVEAGCAICGVTEAAGWGGGLHIDHDHRTGAIRGVLCSACNTALGKFRDSPELLRSAIGYLEASG